MNLVLLSDDVFLWQALERGLKEYYPWSVIIGHCYTIEEGLKAIIGLQPDGVLLDVDMAMVAQDDLPDVLLSDGYLLILLTAQTTVLDELRQQGYKVVLSAPLDVLLLVQMLAYNA